MNNCSIDQCYDFFSLHATKSTLAVLPSIRRDAVGHLLGVAILRRNHEVAADGAFFDRPGLGKNFINEDLGVAVHAVAIVIKDRNVTLGL
jgi:hypothetical protein